MTVALDGEVECDLTMAPGSLVRNGDFAVRWIRHDAPDCWYSTPQGWEGEVIALQPGRKYRLNVAFRPGANGDVLLGGAVRFPTICRKMSGCLASRVSPSARESRR